MKKLCSLGVVSLFVAIAALSGAKLSARQNRTANRGDLDRFVGAWRLVSLEEEGADGKLHKADCLGMFVFSRDGHASVQVMYRDPKTANNAYAQGGYEASYGRYAINERAHTFTFHLDGALVRSRIGQDLPRAYELANTQLIVKSTDPKEHWRVTWEHY